MRPATLAALALLPLRTLATTDAHIDFPSRAPEGLVGNGHSIVRVRPLEFAFFSGGTAHGELKLFVDGHLIDLRNAAASAEFFPGGVVYRLRSGTMQVQVVHGATRTVRYLLGVQVRNAPGAVSFEIAAEGEPSLAPGARRTLSLERREGFALASSDAGTTARSWQELRAALAVPYRTGFRIKTPNAQLDRAVSFNRFLLDLGFNGQLHVCELFRWRDVWSRDLGSGLAPGAMADGDYAAARATIDYDLDRHARADPRGLKVTEDPSQGGSAEGLAWLTRAVWRYYLLTGDREFLAHAAAILRPWLAAWIARDADERGLLIDTTEWMDHSRFFLFPDGARVLYSNVLFAGALGRFATIERTLGDPAAAQRLEAVHERFVRAINALMWNESRGEYDNLLLWGQADARSSSEGNVLAVLAGVAPPARAARLLSTVRQLNWRRAGSVTITPPMSHVDLHNDHNYKVWPWWNAVEARARLRSGDTAGGIELLEKFSDTLDDEHYPGLVEELMTPEGVSEGGHAFVTAAGAYQDAILEGLLGVEILEAGRARIRVAPHVPAAWRSWSAEVPLPQGRVRMAARAGRLDIQVTDPQVKVIEAPASAHVSGARHEPLGILRPAAQPHADPGARLSAPAPLPPPPPAPRTAVTLAEAGLPAPQFAGLPLQHIGAEELATLDHTRIGALIVPGNALPLRSRSGVDVRAALARYLDRGGALVFYGATLHDRQTMGEHGGVVDWYAYRPKIRYTPLGPWRARTSADRAEVRQADETGLRQGWSQADAGESGWDGLAVPGAPDAPAGQPGWHWWRTHVHLPVAAQGRALVLMLGRIHHSDWTYVNGALAGSTDGGDRAFRGYWIRPGEPAYAALRFGADNVIAIQVWAPWGNPSLADTPSLGIEESELGWVPLDGRSLEPRPEPERHGVVSWGPGDFFNSWETSRGVFGFRIDGAGVEFAGPLAGLAALAGPTREAFTDFAVSKPWLFEPLAFTHTQRALLFPDHGERYPAAARLVNTATHGEFILIPASIAATASGAQILKRLRLMPADSQLAGSSAL